MTNSADATVREVEGRILESLQIIGSVISGDVANEVLSSIVTKALIDVGYPPIEEVPKEVTDFRRSLTHETDRGCALAVRAFLETELGDLIRSSLVEERSIDRDLFKGTAPLATFSARIEAAYYLGLISKGVRRDLNLIRKVGNEFAHCPTEVSFDEPRIRDRIRALVQRPELLASSPRGTFIRITIQLLACIHSAQREAKNAIPRSEPRSIDAAPDPELQKVIRERMLEFAEEGMRSVAVDAGTKGKLQRVIELLGVSDVEQ